MSDNTVYVDKFKPRWYQKEFINELEHGTKKRFVVVWPRRAGKDVMALNVMLRQAFKRVGVYYYLYPKACQCRKAIWDAILSTGERFLDFIPSDLIANKNSVEMKITLINGSIIQFNGADNVNTLLSTNPVGVVYSEFATVSNPDAWDRIRPILAANGGWVLFVSTPAPYGYLFEDLFEKARKSSEWHTTMLTTNETKHISAEVLEHEKEEMSEDKFLMEYFCSFNICSTGSYYVKYLDMAYADGRIGHYAHDSMYKVHTAWDLGFRYPTVILFFQVINRKIYVIDMYHKTHEDLSHYVGVLNAWSQTKNYIYGKHFVPHDANNHSISDGLTRFSILRNLGIDPVVLPRSLLYDGIEVVRHTFKRIYIDNEKCEILLKALKEYSQIWDPITKQFLRKDTETWANDYCDSFRYMCLASSKVDGPTQSTEEFNRKRREKMYGADANLSPIYR